MKKVLLSLLVCCATVWGLSAQHHCGFDHILENKIATDANYAAAYQLYINEFQSLPAAGQPRGGVRTVSVAVHVVYNTTAENVPTSQINTMINTLNAAYTASNSNISSVRSQFQSSIGNAQINFCLDTIIRRSTSKSCFDPNTETDAMKSNSTNGSTPLDTRYWLNIWIVDLCGNTGGGVAGYAYLPTAGMHGSSIDGLVIDYSLGFDGGAGGTAPHEIGHYFGLLHPWGNSGGCGNSFPNSDDGFSDTPNTDGPTYSCSSSASACGVTTQVENFMDYSSCDMMFSTGQVNYMNQILTNTRGSLFSSPGCNNSSGAGPTADFSASATLVCPGQTITFSDASIGNPTSWNWTFTGGSPGTSTAQNPTVTYNTPGTYTVTLTATNANGSDTETKTAYITVQAAQSLPLVEGFQGSFLPNNWGLINPDASYTWEKTTTVGGYGTSSASVYINNWDYNAAGSQDLLLTPVYDFSGISNAEMTFDLAYAYYGANNIDSLFLLVTIDCGSNFFLVESYGGQSMSTAGTVTNAAFVPNSSQWRTETVDLSILAGQNSVQFAFLNETGYGQNLYLDNINIQQVANNQPPVANFIGNPTTISVGGSVNFTDQSTNSPTSWNWTFNGAATTSSTQQNPTNIVYNNVGQYTVSLQASNAFGNDTETKVTYINVVAGGSGTCTGITNLAPTDSLRLYSAGPGAGYVSGHNQYGDLAKADKFTGILPNSTVDTVDFYIAVAKDGGTPSNIQVRLWDANGGSGSPGTVLGTVNLPISSINTAGLTTVVFNPPVTVNGDFFAGVEFAYAAGDTIAVVTNRIGDMAAGTGTAWDKDLNGIWNNYNVGWGIDLAHVIFVNVCEPGSTNTPTADFTASSTAVCPGSTVTFTNTSSNATNYAWTFAGGTPGTSSATNPTVTYNTPGTYTVTLVASSTNGSDTETKTNFITVRSRPTGTISRVNPTCNGASNGSVTLAVSGGTSPYTYLWSNGATTQNLSNIPAGSYSVTITDANGCTGTANQQVTQPTAINITVSTTGATCGGANGSATASATGGSGSYTFAWNTGATGATINNLIPGTYSVTATDGSGCTAIASAIVSGGSVVTVTVNGTNATCAGNDGTATATATGGAGNNVFNWSNGQSGAAISGLAPGTYTVTVTDGAGCTASASTTITGASAVTLSFSTTPASCGSSDGSATVTVNGGTPTYSYAWSSGANTATASNLAAGNYTVTVTDGGGCTISGSVSVNNVGGPTASISNSNNVSCNGGNSGSATVSATGGAAPLSYLWSSGATGTTASNLSAGTYGVTVTDNNGCVATASVTITQPTALSLNSSSTTNVSCFGGNDGAASVSASGGSAPYTYSWSGGGSGATRNNLSSGSYTVTVTDANGCTATTSVNISQPNQLTATLTKTNPGCATANGTITANVSGGTSPYSYSWSNGGNANPLTGLVAGNYAVTITDDNGCTFTASTTLSNASGPSVSTTATDVTCGNTANGTASATVTGGTAPYTFNWEDNGGNTVSTSATATNLQAGTYNLTVTDNNGCTSVATQTVGSEGPTVVESITNVTGCFGGNNGAINLTVTGGAAPYNYTWSNGASTRNVGSLVAGTYTVTVADNGGCSVVNSYTVTEPAELESNLTTTDASTSTSNNGTATVNPSGGTAPYSVNWSIGTTGNAIQNLAPGAYSVAITDANNCITTENFTIGVSIGIDQNDVVEAIDIYPNPNSGRFNVSVVLTQTEDVTIEVYNTIGERVYFETLNQVNETTVQIDLSHLAPAAYYVKLHGAQFNVVKKVLKIQQ